MRDFYIMTLSLTLANKPSVKRNTMSVFVNYCLIFGDRFNLEKIILGLIFFNQLGQNIENFNDR